MDNAKDFFEREIRIGDTVIVQDGRRITIGKVSHYSAAGNVIIYAHTNYKLRFLGASMWKRVLQKEFAEDKLVITTDPTHVEFTSDINIKGE